MNPEPRPVGLDEAPHLTDPIALLDNSRGFAVIILDPEGAIVRWNKGAETLFGYTKLQISGKYFGQLFREEDRANHLPENELRQARTAEVASDENWLMRQDGSHFWASGATTALRDDQGILRGFAKMVRDSSERKQLRAALSASEQKFQTTVSQIKDHAIFSTDAAGVITTWNQGCEHILGYTTKEAIGSDARGLLDLKAGVSPQSNYDFKAAAENGAYFNEGPVQRKNGERFSASLITTAVHDSNHTPTGFTIVLRDLTELQRADQTVRNSIERLQLISDTARNLLVTNDPLALIDLVYDRLVSWVDLDFYFHFVGPSAEALTLRAYRGIPSETADAVRQKGYSAAVCQSVASNRAPCVLRDVQHSDLPIARFIREIGVAAYACYPLVANDRLWGTLSFATRRHTSFSPEVLDVFDTVAHLFAEAIARTEVTRALAAREAQLGAVLEGAPSGLLVLDEAGRVMMANAHAELVFGYTRDEFKQLSCEAFFSSQDPATLSVVQNLTSAEPASNGVHRQHEVIARRKDGQEFPADVWLNVTQGPAGKFMIAAFLDTSARKAAERALRESERKLQFLNTVGESTRLLREPTEIMAVITRLLGEHLGATRCAYADVAPDGERFVIPQDYAHGVASSVGAYSLSQFGELATRAMRAGETLVIRNVEREVPSPNAFQSIQIRAIVCCPLVKEGRLTAMMAVHDDRPRDWSPAEIELVQTVVERCWSTIERAKAEQALRRNEERLQLAMEAGRLGLWRYHPAANTVEFDQRIGEFYGQPPELRVVTLGKLVDLIHPDDRAKVRAGLQNSAEHGAHLDVEFRIVLPDRETRWIAAKGDPVGDAGTQLREVIGVNYDMTARKAAEEALHVAQAALQRHASDLEAAVAERTAKLRETISELERFSYSLSHDMRAPLRAMQGFSQILEDEYGSRLDEEGRGYLRRIATAARRLDQLIRDVLSYTHVVRQEVKLQKIDIEPLVRQLISENLALQSPRAEVVVETPLLPVYGHEAYLTQCLSNLLSNGVKFVEPGKIPQVRVRTEARDGVRLYVSDNGIGIPPEWQTRIFGMFERMHPASHYDGTGIGLTIVRKAAERMGGHVGVESQPGRGSTFWIQLQLPR